MPLSALVTTTSPKRQTTVSTKFLPLYRASRDTRVYSALLAGLVMP